jgi:hypothetical protein
MKAILENTRSGNKTLLIEHQGRRFSIYSQYEPIRDGIRFFGRYFERGDDCYIFIGLGLGYQIAPFLAVPEVKKVIVIEPSHEVWEEVRAVPEVREIAENEKVELYSGSEGELFLSALKGRYELLLYGRVKVLVYRPLMRAFEPLYTELERRIRSEIDVLISDGLTIAGFASRWLRNFTKNIKTGSRMMLASSLFDSWRGSAVVAGAGPSLDEALDEIEGRKEKVFLISTDAAVKPVLARGIRPDLICSMDPQPYIVSHFEKVPRDVLLNVPAVVSALSPPQVFWLFRNRYLFFTRHPTTALVLSDRCHGSAVMNFGSVGSLAAALAVRMGFSRVYLAGFDFSFPGMRVYAKNTYFYDYLLRETTRFSTSVTSEVGVIYRRGKRWKNTESHILYTSQNLLSYLEEMEALIRSSAREKKAEFYLLRSETPLKGARIIPSLFTDASCKKIGEKKTVITLPCALPREGHELEPLALTLALRFRFYRGIHDPDRARSAARALFEKNNTYMWK